MDTKSKNSRYSIWYKLIAWVLCLASACVAVVILSGMWRENTSQVVTSENYVDSQGYQREMEEERHQVEHAYFGYGETEKSDALSTYLSALKEKHTQEVSEVLTQAGIGGDYDEYITYFEEMAFNNETQTGSEAAQTVGSADQGVPDSVTRARENASAIYEQLDPYVKKQIDTINQKYAELFADAEEYIANELNKAEQQEKTALENQKEFYYAVVQDSRVTNTNVPVKDAVSWIQNLTANREYKWAETNLPIGVYSETASNTALDGYDLSGVQIYTGLSNDAYAAKQAEYNELLRAFFFRFICVLVCVIVFSAGFLWLMYTAGKSVYDNKIHVSLMDSVYLDIGAVCLVVIVTFIVMGVNMIADRSANAYGALQVVEICSLVSVAAALTLMWSMSVSRRVKQKKSYTLINAIGSGFRQAYEKSGLGTRGVVAVIWTLIVGLILIGLMILLTRVIYALGFIIGLIMIAIYIAVVVKFVLKKAAALQEIATGVEKIKEGQLNYTIPKSGSADMDKIATGIEHIAEGLEAAVQHEVKIERMKTELITNVSHDIKTPLTSILTYVDLMKKEGLQSPNAPKYLEVLDMKSRRLKSLTDDLFEAAKASSGDMKVDMTRIETVQFMEQALGELSDKIDASGLAFVTDLPDETMYVQADGRMLWRVISNVLDNAVKYAAPGSRVYINIRRVLHNICIIVKNVSRDELNMTEEELMERFQRGDESRHTDGSGLGLSIARNFMQMIGGLFSVEIDGDLFKVIISIPEDAVFPTDEKEAETSE